MFEIPLNKFEKEERVIELHKQGKTIRQIAPIVHMSFRDISKIIKAYDKKIIIEQTKKEKQKENNQQIIKKLSLSSQAFTLFKEGKKLDEVKVLLDIPFKISQRYWKQYLKSIGMYECFEFYEVWQYDLPSLLSISSFMKRNNVSSTDILNVLREAKDVLNLRAEVERLKQIKNNYALNQNTNRQQLLPLGLPKYCYEQL